jgi:hypothetical protein
MRTLYRPIAFGLLLPGALLIGSAASGAGDGKDAEATRAKRHAQLAQTQAALNQFCDTTKGWKIAGPGQIAPDLAVLSDPKASADDRLNAAAHIREIDGDASGLSDDKKEQLRMDVQAVKEGCGQLADAEAGLPALTQDGAKLERISEDRWNKLTDKLGAIVLSFKGSDAFGDSSDQNYANCYGKGCDSKWTLQFARLQLTSDAKAQFTTGFEDTLPDAVADLKSPPRGAADGNP